MDNWDYADLCFLDISKAFGIANHRIICEKIAALGVYPQEGGWSRSLWK